MVDLVRTVAAVGESGLARHAIVGGVAVIARLGQAHRATADVDTVVDETRPPDAVQALLRRPDAEADPDNAHRVYIGGTKLEIIGVGPVNDSDLAQIEDREALFVGAHAWALETATELTVVAAADPNASATAPFATAGALIAMKLCAVQSRRATGADKRASDARDIYRLLLDLDTDGAIRAELAQSSPGLRRLVASAAERVLVVEANRTAGWLRLSDDGSASVSAAEIRLLAEPLIAALA